MASKIIQVTSKNYYDVIQYNKHLVLNIRSNHCAPCEKASQLFKTLSEKRKDLIFGIYEVENETSTYFVKNVLQVNAVPTFDVYTDSILMFRTTSPKNFHQLEDYIQHNC